MKVLIIPEDQELDRYIVQPIIEALFEDLEVMARVRVLPEPRLRGADDALDRELVREIVEGNPMEDLFVLIVDLDCDRSGNKEKASKRQREHRGRLIHCLAQHEVEVWMLALYRDQMKTPFRDVREDCDPKERWAEPLLRKLGTEGPGRGRKRAMRAIRGKWRSLRDSCPELRSLQEAIKAHFSR